MKINLPLFHSKGWIHISATASNKSLTLSVQMSTSSSKKAQFHGIYFSSSFSSVKFSLLMLYIFFGTETCEGDQMKISY